MASTNHKYIDIDKLYDFSENLDELTIIKEIKHKYKIRNIGTRDFEINCLGWQLADDYENKRANYKAYIEKGMDARLLMELRNSSILPLGKEYYHYYTDHSKLSTPEEVLKYRDKFISDMVEEYVGLDWQYYMMLRILWGRRGTNIVIDFEPCFADGEDRQQKWKSYYRMRYLEQHVPEWDLGRLYLADEMCV